MAEGAARADRAIDLLVVGHTNVDRFLAVDRLPEADRTVPVTDVREALGGTAANIARSAAREGLTVGLVSRVGAEFPASFRALLERDGVQLGGLEVVRGGRTPSCWIATDRAGRQLTLIDQGAMRTGAGAKLPIDLLRQSRWVHLATGDPGYLLRVLREAHRSGTPASVDPGQELFYRWSHRGLEALLEGAEILFGNRAEIEALRVRLRLTSLAQLLDRVPLVIRTLGAAGAEAISRAGRFRVPGRPLDGAPPTVGAGDAFRGGFYSGWFSGEPLDRCLGLGRDAARRSIASGTDGRRRRGRRVGR